MSQEATLYVFIFSICISLRVCLSVSLSVSLSLLKPHVTQTGCYIVEDDFEFLILYLLSAGVTVIRHLI